MADINSSEFTKKMVILFAVCALYGGEQQQCQLGSPAEYWIGLCLPAWPHALWLKPSIPSSVWCRRRRRVQRKKQQWSIDRHDGPAAAVASTSILPIPQPKLKCAWLGVISVAKNCLGHRMTSATRRVLPSFYTSYILLKKNILY